MIVIVICVIYENKSQLFQIPGALDPFGFLPCLVQRRQQHPRQNGYDRYDYKELYQRKVLQHFTLQV